MLEELVDAYAGGEYGEELGLGQACGRRLRSVYPIAIDPASIDREKVDQGGAARPGLRRRGGPVRGRASGTGWTKSGDEELPRNLERWITLQVLDTRWREHLDNVDYMRQGIGLRGYAQKDPLVEYGIEGQAMFEEMNVQVMQEVVRILMHAEVDVESGVTAMAGGRPAFRARRRT